MTENGERVDLDGKAAEPVDASEDPNAPIIVDAPPDSPEFGVVQIPGTGKVGGLLELLQDLFRGWQ
jgi:hypothetical protein